MKDNKDQAVIRVRKNPTPWEITHQADLLLFDEHPLVVRPTLAKLVGLNEAIILQQVHYWIVRNAELNRNFKDGEYWTYNSVREWQEQFPFWSYDTIKRTLTKLSGRKTSKKDKAQHPKLLITANYNTLKIDRTLWYRIDYDLLGIMAVEANKIPLGQNAPMEKGRMPQPLPETYSKTSTGENSDLFATIRSIEEQDRLAELHWQAEQSMYSKDIERLKANKAH